MCRLNNEAVLAIKVQRQLAREITLQLVAAGRGKVTHIFEGVRRAHFIKAARNKLGLPFSTPLLEQVEIVALFRELAVLEDDIQVMNTRNISFTLRVINIIGAIRSVVKGQKADVTEYANEPRGDVLFGVEHRAYGAC